MLDIIKSYVKDEKYYVVIMEKGVYIKNVENLISVRDEEVLLRIDKHIWKITGSNFVLTKSMGREISIAGHVEGFNQLWF